MKRYIVLILTVALLLPCLAVPAYATDGNVVQGIIDQTQSLKDYFSLMWSDVQTWWAGEINIIQNYLLNIRNYIQWLYGYFTDETYGEYNDGSTTYPVTHFQMDMIDLWGFNWFWLVDVLDTGNPNNTLGQAIEIIRYYTYKLANGFTSYFTDASKSYLYKSYGWINGEWGVISQTTQYVTPFVYDLRTSIDIVLSYFKFLVKGNYVSLDEDKAPIETEADSMIDSMETAPTINVEDIETQVDQVTQFEPDADYLDILSSIFLNEVFLTMFSWSIILAMLGYILYGKV